MNEERLQQDPVWKIILYISLSIPGALIIMLLFGFGSQQFFALPGYLGLVRQPPEEERVHLSVPTNQQIELVRSGEYMILSDVVTVGARPYPIERYETVLLDPNQTPVLLTPDGEISWDTEDLKGTRLYTFRAKEPGIYTLQVTSERSDQWTVLPNYGRSNQLILLTFFSTIIGAILIGWRRRERWLDRHRKANAQEKGAKFDEWMTKTDK